MRRKLAVRTLAVWVGLAALCASGAAQAQQTTSGAIIGTVRSAVGRGVLAGVTVIATSPALQAEQVSVTDDRGSFRLTLLPPGTYSLHFESAGFRPADQPGVIVEVGRTVRIDFDIAPETVEAPRVIVRDRAPTVDQESSAVSENVRRELLENTPAPRTYSQVLQLAPGTSSDRLGTTVFGSTGWSNGRSKKGLTKPGRSSSGFITRTPAASHGQARRTSA